MNEMVCFSERIRPSPKVFGGIGVLKVFVGILFQIDSMPYLAGEEILLSRRVGVR
jgi:hypothetical protein